MNAKLKKRLAVVDKLYKQALSLADPDERKLLVRAHANLDQLLAVKGDLRLLNTHLRTQFRIFETLKAVMAQKEKEEDNEH